MKTTIIYHTNENFEVVKVERRIDLFGFILKRTFIEII